MGYGKYKIKLRTKFAISSLIFALILSTGLVVVSYINYKSSMVEKYTEHITAAVNSAAMFVSELDSKDYIDKSIQYNSEGKNISELIDENFNTVNKQLNVIKEANNLEYIVCYHPEPNGLYVLMQTDAGEYTYTLGYFSEVGVDYGEEDIAFANSLITDPNTEKTLISDTKYGYLISSFNVVNDSDGNPYLVVCADMSMQKIKDVLNSYVTLAIINATLIIAIFLIAYIIYMRYAMINPLQKLVNGAVKFVSNNTGLEGANLSSMDVHINTGDEIEDLAKAFNKMTEDIITYINNLTKMTAERERIDAELHVATNIQKSMLPNKFPAFPDRTDFDIYATMDPAKEVGGDLYDFFMIDENHLALVLGDVSGKGVPAALFMVKAKTAIRNAAMSGLTPAQVFTEANEQLCDNNEGQLFVTGWMGVIDLTTGIMTCVNAGHNPPIFRKPDGTCEYLQMRPGFVLAGMEGIRYKQFELKFEEGAAIYIYTDGVTEATNANNELYGEDRLIKLINNINMSSPEDLLKTIKKDVDKFVGDAPQFDDITMLGFTYKWSKK